MNDPIPELQQDCATLEQLKAFGEKRGYKPGWAQHIWDARQARQKKDDPTR